MNITEDYRIEARLTQEPPTPKAIEEQRARQISALQYLRLRLREGEKYGPFAPIKL